MCNMLPEAFHMLPVEDNRMRNEIHNIPKPSEAKEKNFTNKVGGGVTLGVFWSGPGGGGGVHDKVPLKEHRENPEGHRLRG